MPLKTLAYDNLSSRAYAAVREALINGDFRPGERLVIQDLAEKLGTSVTPVREGCLRLVSERGLEIRSGRFLVVPDMELSRYIEIRKMRLALEGLATAEAAMRGGQKEIDALRALHARFYKANSKRDHRTATRLNREFHFGVYRLSGMNMLLAQIESLWVSMGPILRVYHEEGAEAYIAADEHVKMLDAIESGNAADAEAALKRDIERGGQGIMQYLESLAVKAV